MNEIENLARWLVNTKRRRQSEGVNLFKMHLLPPRWENAPENVRVEARRHARLILAGETEY